jgi:hypothetical protein
MALVVVLVIATEWCLVENEDDGEDDDERCRRYNRATDFGAGWKSSRME